MDRIEEIAREIAADEGEIWEELVNTDYYIKIAREFARELWKEITMFEFELLGVNYIFYGDVMDWISVALILAIVFGSIIFVKKA